MWLLIVPYALVMAGLAVLHALVVRAALEPVNTTLADYASRLFVIATAVVAGWYGEAICTALARWEASRRETP